MCAFGVKGQNLTFFFGGQITNYDTGKKESGVTVSIVSNGKTYASAVTSSNGKYIVKALIPANATYEVVIAKPGFVSKKVAFDFSTMNMGDVREGETYDPLGQLNMEIFTEKPGLDFSFLKTDPVASFKYDPAQMGVRNDAAMSQRVKKKIEDLLAQEQKEEDQKKDQYSTAIKSADGLYAQGKYEEALKYYEDAARIMPTEKHPQTRIADIDAILKDKQKEQQAAAAKQKQYQNLIAAGDNLRNQKKYSEAIAKYNEAYGVMPEQYPKDEIKKIETILAKEKEKEAADKKYQETLAAAETAFNSKDWNKAKSLYTEASKLNSADPLPREQIKKIDAALREEAANNALDKSYEEAMKLANNLFTQNKIEEAKAKYTEASKLKPTETAPKDGIKKCDDQLAKMQADTQKEAKIKALFEEGQKLIDAKNYPQAKTKYKEIQTLDPSKNLAQVKLDEIDRILADEEKAKNLEADFKKAVQEGDQFAKSNNLEMAKERYGAALQLKSDPSVHGKYDKVVADMATNQADALVKKKYDEAISVADNLFAQNKLEEAKSKYKEAAALDGSQAKPREKIAQIDAQLSKDTALDEKYKQAMDRGNSLMKEEKYLDAIKEYNLALGLKPNEIEPKRKAEEAERMEKAKNNEADLQFEKIISTAQTKIEEGSYEKAKELLNRAKTFRPEDKRPNQMLAEIERLMQGEKALADNLTKAKKAEDAKDYPNAIKYYSEAYKLNSSDQKVKDKIDELKKLQAAVADEKQKEKLFEENVNRGNTAFGLKRYENALESYENALSFKPGDQKTKDRIQEIKQIMDDLAKAAKADEDMYAQFESLVQKADEQFQLKNFEEAAKIYQEASKVNPSSPYPKRQIDECKRLISKISSRELQAKYDQLITNADIAYERKELEKAKTIFNEALDLKPSEAYPKKRIAEIDALLNPVIVDNGKLEPLGEAFEGDGELELAKADLQRKNQKNQTVDDVTLRNTAIVDSISNEKKQDNLNKSDEIFKVNTQVRERNEEAKNDLQESESKLKTELSKIEEQNEKNQAYDRKEQLQMKENIASVENRREETSQSQKELLEAKTKENNAVVSNMNLKAEEAFVESQKGKQNEAQQLKTMSNEMEQKDQAVATGVIELNQAQIKAAEMRVNEMEENRANSNYAGNVANQASNDAVVSSVYSKNTQDAEIARKNALDVDETSLRAENIERSRAQEMDRKSKQTTQSVDQIEDRILVEDIGRDEKRVEAIEQLKSNQTNLDDKARQEYNAQMERRYSANDQIVAEEKERYRRALEAQEEDKQSYTSLDEIKKRTIKEQEALQTSDDTGNKETTTAINQVTSKVEENARTTTERQEENQQTVNDFRAGSTNKNEQLALQTQKKVESQKQNVEDAMSAQRARAEEALKVNQQKAVAANEISDAEANTQRRNEALNREKQIATQGAIHKVDKKVEESSQVSNDKQFENSKVVQNATSYRATDNAIKAEDTRKKNQQAQAKLDKMNNDPTKIENKNSLGQEYPEGVTEEKFKQNDEKGILKAIITRRIVVVEGHGDVYVRTQTTTFTTYTKNGEPTTEYVWQKETQGGKLVRN